MKFDYRQQYHMYRRHLEQLMAKAQAPVAKVSLAVVGTMLTTAFLIVAAIRPTAVVIASLTREIADEKEISGKLDQKIQALQQAQQRLTALEPTIPLLGAAIPQQVEIELVIKQLEMLASEKGMVLLEINQPGLALKVNPNALASSKKSPQVYSLPVQLSIGGSEQAVRQFLGDLEQLDRLITVSSVQLAWIPPDQRQERPYSTHATIKMDVFTMQPVNELEEKAKKPVPSGEEGLTP